ncbi:MAG: VIT domain-containing protein, partial [Myxococcota bacterium]
MVQWMWGAWLAVAGAQADDHARIVTEAGPLVLVHTEVDAVVQMGLAVVDVTQTFHNPYDTPIDATYVFPLSPGAAVRAMSMTCGGRTLVASVEEREQARATYDRAVREGRKAALLEQQRDDLFTQEIGRLCPGEAVEVTLQYAEGLERTDGAWSLVFPTTVGERYAPMDLELPPMIAALGQRGVDLQLTLDEGLPLGSVWSDSHAIAIQDERWGAQIGLAEGTARPDADLHVAWSLATPEPAAAALVAHPPGARDSTVALRIEPPPAASVDDPRDRELLFVLDSSCSMRGTPWAASVDVVLAALDQTHPADTFNLVKFSSAASSLFARPAPATPDNLARAEAWLKAFDGGGTEMTSGIVHALDMPGDPEALRVVLLLTDGYIGNDREVFETVHDHLGGNDRIFALGVGSAPNRGLLSELAYHGRGDAQYALPGTPIAETVSRFADRIATPVLTDVEV